MSQLETVFDKRISSDANSASASYVSATSPKLLAASFVNGKKYLLLVRAEMSVDLANAVGAVKVRHGTTDFAESEMVLTPIVATNDRLIYEYMTVFTYTAGEDIEMQYHGDGTNSVRMRWGSMLAIRLSDALTENTDWFFTENTTLTALTTSFANFASLTFTPATGGQNWLVLSTSLLEIDATADAFVSRIDQDSGAAGWDTIYGGRAVNDKRTLPNAPYIGTLTAASHTFKVQAKRIGTTASSARHRRSAVFALNLAKFDVATFVSSDTQVNGVDFNNWSMQAATIAHSQAIDNGKVLSLAYFQFSPLTDNNAVLTRYYTARVQKDQIDIWSTDGVTQSYSVASGFARMFLPVATSVQQGQAFPYMHYSQEVLGAGSSTFDLDFGTSNTNLKGVRYIRLLALSLDVAAAPPPAGSGAGNPPERNEQIMYLHDPKAARRRVMVRCVDATDNVTPEAGEAGGQPAFSINGGAFTTTGIGVLVNVDNTNGLYYAELTQAVLSELGSLRVRYKTAATALFTVTLPIEELPTLYDGLATGGGANYADLSSPPTFVQPGTIARIVFGTGVGQSMLVQSFSTPRITMEGNWSDSGGVNPDATSRIVLEPGLPFVVPDANVAQVNKSTTAAVGLQEGAELVQTFLIRTGANSPTNLVTSLPITVGGVTTPPNFWANRGLIVKTGPLAGDEALITASSVSGSDTILTVATLTGTPAVGVKCALL